MSDFWCVFTAVGCALALGVVLVLLGAWAVSKALDARHEARHRGDVQFHRPRLNSEPQINSDTRVMPSLSYGQEGTRTQNDRAVPDDARVGPDGGPR